MQFITLKMKLWQWHSIIIVLQHLFIWKYVFKIYNRTGNAKKLLYCCLLQAIYSLYNFVEVVVGPLIIEKSEKGHLWALLLKRMVAWKCVLHYYICKSLEKKLDNYMPLVNGYYHSLFTYLFCRVLTYSFFRGTQKLITKKHEQKSWLNLY